MPENIFDYLDRVRERPTMFVRSLEDLQSQVWGYLMALRNHEIDEHVPSMGRHFLYYVREKTAWGLSRGWAHAIGEHVDGFSQQLETFFSYVDTFRKLVPTAVARAVLTDDHKPTGKRRRCGFDGLMTKPSAVDVVQYRPEPLHFLRFHFADRTEDDDLLFNHNLQHATTIDDAKLWVHDEFGVDTNCWHEIA